MCNHDFKTKSLAGLRSTLLRESLLLELTGQSISNKRIDRDEKEFIE